MCSQFDVALPHCSRKLKLVEVVAGEAHVAHPTLIETPDVCDLLDSS